MNIPPPNMLLPLSWDSDFLGYGVARLPAHLLTVDALNEQIVAARRAELRLLYMVAAPNDAVSNASAQAAGAWLADRKVIFGMTISPDESRFEVTPAIHNTTAWTPRLESLALQSGEYSRFRLDPNFAPEVFARLYSQWLRNSLAHQLAREVLIFEKQTDNSAAIYAQGLLTLGLKQGRADIGLLAVDVLARGQRIGQQLVLAARQRAAAWGLEALQVVTQLDNELACAFYRRCGFVEWEVENVYHLWL